MITGFQSVDLRPDRHEIPDFPFPNPRQLTHSAMINIIGLWPIGYPSSYPARPPSAGSPAPTMTRTSPGRG
jgi:hypothetical protein